MAVSEDYHCLSTEFWYIKGTRVCWIRQESLKLHSSLSVVVSIVGDVQHNRCVRLLKIHSYFISHRFISLQTLAINNQ